MMTGIIKWFNINKGYGFVSPDNGTSDVFIHISALEKAGILNINDGQKIEFELASNRGKQSAVHIKLIGAN